MEVLTSAYKKKVMNKKKMDERKMDELMKISMTRSPREILEETERNRKGKLTCEIKVSSTHRHSGSNRADYPVWIYGTVTLMD